MKQEKADAAQKRLDAIEIVTDRGAIDGMETEQLLDQLNSLRSRDAQIPSKTDVRHLKIDGKRELLVEVLIRQGLI